MAALKWTIQIDQITGEFKETFGHLSPEQLNRKPEESTWSVAQILEHLIIVNESYFPVINAVREGTFKLPFVGKIGFIVKLMEKALLNAVQPGQKSKTRTFPIWEPRDESQSDILKKFEKHQEDLKRLINNSEDLLKKRTVISSPANRNIVYSLETAFDIIVAHEQRHLLQAKEILSKQFASNL